jgi:EF hand
MRIWHFFLVGILALLLGPGSALTQFQGGRGGGRGGRGGGMRMDPGQMFDMMAGGKKEIVISEVTDQRRQGFLNRIAQTAGITNGKITRDQYVAGLQQMMGQFGRGGNSGVPQKPDAAAPAPADAGAGGGAGGADTAALDQEAEADFKRRDLNGDGFLNPDEMPGSLRREWQQWDTNKDGKIDLKEYKAYYAARQQQRQQQWGGQPVVPVEEEEKKPPVYRAGKLPQGIPAWFEQYDTDKDGQIGLYEWKQTGKPIEEFLAMDKNQDGFLTIQEVMAYINKGKKTNGQAAPSSPGNVDGQNGGANPSWQGANRQGRGRGQGGQGRNGGQGQSNNGGDASAQGFDPTNRQGRGRGGRRNRDGN